MSAHPARVRPTGVRLTGVRPNGTLTNRLLTSIALTLVGAAAARPVPGQQPDRPLDRSRFTATVDSIVAAALPPGTSAGAAVAVVRGADTLVMRGYGYADVEFDVPMPARAIFEIGSVTKQFTAAAIMQLVEQGKVLLDDDLTKYLPTYPTHGRHISVRRLLDHTSGVRNYTDIPAFATIQARKLPKDSLVALFAAEPLDFEPGAAMSYTNSGYFLLGLIIERASGLSYAEYVQRNLFQRAGMADSRYCGERAVVTHRAHGYQPDSGRLLRAEYIDHTYPYAAGSLCSTVNDLVAWNAALHGGRILGPRAYAELVTPGTLADGTPLRYAKALAVDSTLGHRRLHHSGGIYGFVSELAYFPDDRTSIVVLLNTSGSASPTAMAQGIAEALFGRPAAAARVARFAGDLAQFAGEYGARPGARPGTPPMRVALVDGVLALQPASGAATPLRYLGGDTFEAGSGRYTFLRAGGRVTRLRADNVSRIIVLTRQ